MNEATKTHFQTLASRRQTYRGKRRMQRVEPLPVLEVQPATRDYLRQMGRRGGKKVAHLMRKLVREQGMVPIGVKGGSVKSPAKKAAAKRRWESQPNQSPRWCGSKAWRHAKTANLEASSPFIR
jgi:hypothetical protein